MCCCCTSLFSADNDVAPGIVVAGRFSDSGMFAADHQTHQFLFHCILLQGIDERVHADVQVGQEELFIQSWRPLANYG